MTTDKKPSERLKPLHDAYLREHDLVYKNLYPAVADAERKYLAARDAILDDLHARLNALMPEPEPTPAPSGRAERAREWAEKMVKWNSIYGCWSLFSKDGINLGNLSGLLHHHGKESLNQIASHLTAFAAAEVADVEKQLWVAGCTATDKSSEIERLRAELAEVSAALPSTYYAQLSTVERVKMLSEHWNRLIATNKDLQADRDDLLNRAIAAEEQIIESEAACAIERDVLRQHLDTLIGQRDKKIAELSARLNTANCDVNDWRDRATTAEKERDDFAQCYYERKTAAQEHLDELNRVAADRDLLRLRVEAQARLIETWNRLEGTVSNKDARLAWDDIAHAKSALAKLAEEKHK